MARRRAYSIQIIKICNGYRAVALKVNAGAHYNTSTTGIVVFAGALILL